MMTFFKKNEYSVNDQVPNSFGAKSEVVFHIALDIGFNFSTTCKLYLLL